MSSLAATWFYSIDFDAQKQPAMPCDQNHLEVENIFQKLFIAEVSTAIKILKPF